MNHSFICLPGCHVYPQFCYLSHDMPWDADFDRFVVQPTAAVFNELTYSEDTQQDMEENKPR